MTEREKQRLERIDERLLQMQAQKQDILAREKKRLRAERTRRLIQIGALSEKYFDVKDISPTDYEEFLKLLVSVSGVGENIAHIKGQPPKIQP